MPYPTLKRGKWTQSDRVEKLFKVWVFRLAVHLYSDGGDDWTVVYFHFCLLFMLTLASPHVSRSLFPLCMCVRSTLWGIFIHQMTSVSFPHWGKQALKCMSFSYASLNSCKCFCVWQRYKLYQNQRRMVLDNSGAHILCGKFNNNEYHLLIAPYICKRCHLIH